jgi:DNA-binding NtrC family response regulator
MKPALIVDDANDNRRAMAEWLAAQGFDPVRGARTLREARERVNADSYDLVLLDLSLPDGQGLQLLDFLQQDGDQADIVVITGHGSIDSAVEAMRAGATDYLTKPVDLPRLEGIVRRIRRTQQLRGQVHELRAELARLGRFGRILGASDVMRAVYDLIGRVAPTSSTVLITGETGTGKELVAQTLHDLSPRAEGPFVPINCGAVPPNLIESELFGHEKGSFTGADRRHCGIFERADGGTLLFDEISEMPLDVQVKLLRVLETGRVVRVGGDANLSVDVRVVAASNRDLEQAVEQGKFRRDLFYRLNVFPIVVPPLRQRGQDIVLLAEHFLSRINDEAGTRKRFTREALDRMAAHDWPGNVRELRNAIERASIVSGDEIGPEAVLLAGALAVVPPPRAGSASAMPMELGVSIPEAERRLILFTLDHLGWNKRRAADVLGISLKTLYNRLNAYGIKNAGAATEGAGSPP